MQRRSTNPVFNDRKLKLGTFGTNLDRGCAISSIDGVLEINWPNTLELAKTSEEMEFEALVPIGRWHGFGGVTNFNGPGFECFSWAAAIGASTHYSSIFATSHVPTIHPVMAAKQAALLVGEFQRCQRLGRIGLHGGAEGVVAQNLAAQVVHGENRHGPLQR